MNKQVFAVLLAGTMLAGCDAQPGVTPSLLPQGFTVRELRTNGYYLVGLEGFDVRLRVPSPAGRQIKAYGVKTAFETTVWPIPELPMPIADGAVLLETVQLSVAPHRGDYPFELWLINERDEESNHLQGHVFIQ